MKPSPAPVGLVRALGPVMATAIVVGTIIGSGIFKKPRPIAQSVEFFGPALLVWVAGGVLVLLGALAYGEVAVLLPRAGGNYVFLREAYGRLAGFLWGWVDFCIIRAASLAALATIFTESLHDVLANPSFQEAVGLPASSGLSFWMQRGVTVAVLLGLALVNARGVRWGGVVQVVVTTVKVASLLLLLVLPLAAVVGGLSSRREVDVAHWQPVWPDSWQQLSLGGLTTALLQVLWAYHGWQNIAPVAEEVRHPQRNLPLALLAGVVTVMALYVGVNAAYALVLSSRQMATLPETTTVATEVCLRLLGPLGAAVASAAVMTSVFGALNGNLLVGPRLLYAMGADGLAPRGLHEVHTRYHTPARAILVLALWASLLVVGVAVLIQMEWIKEKTPFDELTDFAMFGVIIFETLAVVSIFVFRRRWPDAPRPYRCWGYPVVPALYVFLPALILVNMFLHQLTEAVAGIVFIHVGIGVYILVQRRAQRVVRARE
jgi:amino acid transporter